MELEPLCRFTAELNRTELVVPGPLGRRIIGPIINARLEGERLKASQRGTSAADWLLLADDGTTYIDVRMALVTDDGAFIYLTYAGRADWSGGVLSGPVYSAPTFATEDPRYQWLNPLQCAGKGRVFEGGAEYEIAVLR